MVILSEPASADGPAPTELDDVIALLRERFSETVRWCAAGFDRTSPGSSLRRLPHRPLLEPAGPTVDIGAEVADLVSDRRAALSQLPADPDAPAGGGRIVSFIPEETLSDGVAAAETNGYFDVDNAPPQDTWIAAVSFDHPVSTPIGLDHPAGQTHVLALVPGPLIDTVGFGLRANPEACIFWLDQVVPNLAAAINPPR